MLATKPTAVFRGEATCGWRGPAARRTPAAPRQPAEHSGGGAQWERAQPGGPRTCAPAEPRRRSHCVGPAGPLGLVTEATDRENEDRADGPDLTAVQETLFPV